MGHLRTPLCKTSALPETWPHGTGSQRNSSHWQKQRRTFCPTPISEGGTTSARPEHRIIKRRTADRPPLIFFLKQFKKRLFIVLYEIPDIRLALFDDGVPLGFQLYFLRFRAAGVFGVQLAVCFQCAPVRRFVGGTLEAGPCADGHEDPRCDGVGKIRLILPREEFAELPY